MAFGLFQGSVRLLLATVAAGGLWACGGGDVGTTTSPAPSAMQTYWPPPVVSPDLLMRWAESAHPHYFSPPGRATQFSNPYVYRYYPQTNAYLGVAGQDIFVLGAPFGTDVPTRVGALSDYQCTVVPASCWDGAQSVPIKYVPASFYGSWPRKSYVIRNAQEWAAAWAEKQDLGSPAPLPTVDFTAYAVLGGADGWSSNGCGGIEPKLILRLGSDYRVLWGTSWTGPYEACLDMVTPRVTFVLVPQPVGNVEFIEVPAY